jgi:hypothetical protein
MTDLIPEAIRLEQAGERLRQERETFNQSKSQVERWFRLRLAMGWTAVALLPSMLTVSGYVIFNHDRFTTNTVAAASSAIFVDGIGFLIAVWKIVLNPGSTSTLSPVTTIGGGTS